MKYVVIPGRNANQCQQRWRRCLNVETKGPWKDDENERLQEAVRMYTSSDGTIDWKQVARFVRTRPCEKCRAHWDEVLSPKVNKS